MSTRNSGTDEVQETPAAPAGPRPMLDSDIEGLMRQYNLTRPEAEELWNRSDAGNGSDPAGQVVDTIKGARVVYRPVYEQVPATLSHPLVAIDERARLQALEGAEAEPVEPVPDATRPESGPYGPHANYPKAEVSPEEIAQQTGLPVEVVTGEVAS